MIGEIIVSVAENLLIQSLLHYQFQAKDVGKSLRKAPSERI